MLRMPLRSFNARYYDPISGTWMSNDPIGIAGGLNQYVAFNNNPVNFRDPRGLEVTEQDVLDAYVWINENYPEITEGFTPAFFVWDTPAEGLSLSIPGRGIIIDKDLPSQEWVVNMVAHELMHTQLGFWKNQWEMRRDPDAHDRIYDRAGEIQNEWNKQNENQSRTSGD